MSWSDRLTDEAASEFFDMRDLTGAICYGDYVTYEEVLAHFERMVRLLKQTKEKATVGFDTGVARAEWNRIIAEAAKTDSITEKEFQFLREHSVAELERSNLYIKGRLTEVVDE